MKKHKVIVIGGGAAGLYTAAGLARFGVDIALVDAASEMGGDCLHTGCVPSKTLLHWAEKGLSWTSIQAKMKETITILQENDSDRRFRDLGVTLYKGHAVFHDKKVILVGRKTMLTADKFVLATGARPIIPSIPGLSPDMYDTHETLFTRMSLPKRSLIIGAGAVGLEIGQALAKMGTEVTLLDRNQLFLPGLDREVAEAAYKRLSRELSIHLDCSITKVERTEGKICVTIHNEKQLFTDHLFIAAGRQPETSSLRLDTAGVEKNPKQNIKVNAYLQTTNPHIYAAGDCIGAPMLTHAAGEEARTIITNLIFGRVKKMSYHGMAAVIYTDPEIYQLFSAEVQGKEQVYTFTSRGTDTDRFIIDGEPDAIVKIKTNKKGRILGAQAVGTLASSYMQLVASIAVGKRSLAALASIPYPYPLKSEILKTIANQYLLEKFQHPFVQAILRVWLRLRRLKGEKR
ncbi:NAD(P)/FAD-dependent oxidoreductase [Bacillaceae bacterium Marseille-Q3522]|nr:NAD(P)/FAD-dependent oxidoreductase [Bacillaceae bacterium Marseille-Q3522]